MILAQVKIHETVTGTYRETQAPATIAFEPIRGDFRSRLLPTKDGYAKGHVDTEKVAAQFRHDGQTFLKDGEDVTQRSIEDYLLKHQSYGLEFVAVGEDGHEIGSDRTDVVKEGERWWCLVCEKYLDGRGKDVHVEKSKEHLEKSALAARQRNFALSA